MIILLLNGINVSELVDMGMSAGTFVMAIATGIMAYYTHLSVKSSNEQLELNKKQFTFKEITFETERILDQMRLIIKPLREELTSEINIMQSTPVNFRASKKYDSLKFPIPNSKTFFIPNEEPKNMTGQEMPLHHTILNLRKIHPELLTKLEERYNIYLQIASKITNIEKELESDTSKEQLESLVKTYCSPRNELIDSDNDYWDEVIEIHTQEEEMVDGRPVPVSYNYYQVPVSQFIKQIIALLFDEIWDIDQENVDLFDEEVIWISLNVRKEFIEMKKDSEIWSLKEEVNLLLLDLQNVDRSLKTIIDNVISEYKEKYHLSAQQLA